MSTTFADFPLAEQFQQALTDLGFTAPTPVQVQAIPAALEGKDLLVSSQTGSGKTVAFLLPTLNPLAGADQLQSAKDRMRSITAPQVLVLCPTRELAQQVSQDAIALVRHVRGLRVATIVGGMPFAKQIAQLKGAQLVVATPGRLLDLVNRRQLSLGEVSALIVDEADRMLDLGFSEDLEAISDLARDRKQTLMFSATFAGRIVHLAERMMKDPVRIAIETGSSTNADVEQTLHYADGFEHKKKLLSHWLSDETMDQAVVFASTQEDTDMLAEELAEAGHLVVALHGGHPQTVRNRRIKTLREGRARILVATDVAARGLDVPGLTHVINFGLPMKNEDYVHRIGRTGRAGRSGRAITLALHRERGKIRGLEDYLNARLAVTEIAGLEPTPQADRPRGGAGRNDRGGDRGRGGRPGGNGRSFGGGDRSDSRPARPFNRDGGGERRSFGGASEGSDRPARPAFNREGGDRSDSRPARPFNRDGGERRSFGGGDRSDSRPARPFNRDGGGERRSFGGASESSDRPARPAFNREGGERRSFGGGNSNDDNRGNRVDYRSERPARSFGDKPAGDRSDSRPARREFGGASDRPARREFGGGSDRPARREFGGASDRPARREFGGERSFGGANRAPNVEHKKSRFADQAYANKPRSNSSED